MDDVGKFANLTEYHSFMVVVGLLLLSECAIWVLSARGGGGARSRSDRGTVWLVILGWCCSAGAGAYFRSRSAPEFLRNWLLPHFSYFIGLVLIVLGIAVRGAAVMALKKAFTLSVQTTSDQRLIRSGLYHVVRNPAYTGSMLSLLGIAFAYRHILGIVVVLALCLICYGIRIGVEEKALNARFGEEFAQYCGDVKYRLIPGVF